MVSIKYSFVVELITLNVRYYIIDIFLVMQLISFLPLLYQDDRKDDNFWSILECLSYRYKFDLNLANRAFLDLAWELPIYKTFELVPVTDLGLMIAVIKGHVIVSQVKEYSVAGEDHKVRI